MSLAVLSLGQATSVNYGQFHPQAMPWLALSLLSTAAAWARIRRSQAPAPLAVAPVPHRLERAVWIAVVMVQGILLLGRGPLLPASAAGSTQVGIRLAIVATLVCATAGLLLHVRFRWACLGAMLAAYFIGGCLMLRGYPAPVVDVIEFQRDACDALLAGQSPYSITFRDIAPAGSDFYASGVSVGGRLQFGFPYPPLSLLMVLPFHVLGDFRFAGLAAMTVAAGLLGGMTRSRQSLAAAAMLLLTPMGYFVLWAGWTEPLGVMLLSAVLFTAVRRGIRRAEGSGGRSAAWMPVAFGVLLAVKQYFVLLLPLVPLLARPGERARTFRNALLTAAAVSLPLVLCDPSGFIHSVVMLQFRQPYRADALSFLAPLQGHVPAMVAATLPLAMLLVFWVSLRKSRPDPAAFALAVSLCLLIFFAFNKQAFCNYYYLVIGALCAAVATSGSEFSSSSGDGGARNVFTRNTTSVAQATAPMIATSCGR